MNPLDPSVGGSGVAGLGSGGGTAVTKPASPTTLTQTFATADATHAARTANAPAAATTSAPAVATYAAPSAITAAALTVTDGVGTNDGTIGAITDNASTIAAVQELAAQIGKLVTDLTSVRTQLVALAADDADLRAKLTTTQADAANLRTELTALRVDSLDTASFANSMADILQSQGEAG